MMETNSTDTVTEDQGVVDVEVNEGFEDTSNEVESDDLESEDVDDDTDEFASDDGDETESATETESDSAEGQAQSTPKDTQKIREQMLALMTGNSPQPELNVHPAQGAQAAIPQQQFQQVAPNSANQNLPAPPDPTDFDKYPNGHLDHNYVQDAINWTTQQTVQALISDFDRQQNQKAQEEAQRKETEKALDLVVQLTEKGVKEFPDFFDKVNARGMAGEYDIELPTIKAANLVDQGAKIMYELANDTAKAKEVAAMDAVDQCMYVFKRNHELQKAAARKPQAIEPPATKVNGRRAVKTIRPDTDNIADFHKLWLES